MLPSPDTCLRAFLDRDAAYDGVFFVAVRTTGIYCRPVCRVRQPLPRNITFLPSAAACEQANYRPCLRCRPESAPFSPAWNGTSSTVARALRLIEAGALDTAGVTTLAARLGIGPRHLTRLLTAQTGAPPAAIARTARLQRAKRLLNQTDLSIDAIAARAGFPSPRRMSAAFTALYGRPPSALRPAALAKPRLTQPQEPPDART